MDEASCVKLLEAHGIKPTANRILVMKALAGSMEPQSLADMERTLLTVDRSNIFRALVLFRDHHLVHAIEGGNEGTRFELCHSHSHEHDDDQHPHFYCEKCQRFYCLDYTEVPEIQLPEGFMMTSSNFIIKGICPHCNRKIH